MKFKEIINKYVDKFRRTHRLVKRISLMVTISMVTITIVTGAFTLLMARVPEYRLQMQAWVSDHAKLDVQFATLSARWYHFGPQLEFSDAVIRSRDGKRILAMAKSGSLGFDLWAAIRTTRLTALQFSLHGTELKAIRKPDGVYEIVGQSDLPEYEHHEAFALDSLPVGRVSISDVRLVFRDLKTKRGPWIVDNVDLSILRDNDSIEIEGQATLPTMLGKQLKFRAAGKGGLDEVDQLQWHAQVSGHDLNLKGWAQVMTEDWIAPREGFGSFDVSADFLGVHLQGFTGQIDFNNVVMKLPVWKIPLPVADTLYIRKDDGDIRPVSSTESVVPNVQSAVSAPIRYNKFKLAFNTVLTSEGWQTQFTNVQLEQEHARWEPSTATLLIKLATVRDPHVATDDSEAPVEHRVIERLNASAQLIVLDNLWPLMAYLPESEKLARVRAFNATGRVEKVAVRYERDLLGSTSSVSSDAGDADAHDDDAGESVAMSAPRYSFRADFKDIGISPVGRTPGVSGLSGGIEGSGAHGTVRLASHDVEVAIPHVFRTPLPADQISATVNWTRSVTGTRLQSDDLAIKSPNGDATAQLTLDIPLTGSPMIDMKAQGTNLDAASAPRYMPAGFMQRRALDWLDSAFLGGHVKKADLTLSGPLKKFPFRDNEGLFLITAEVNDLALQYQPGWMIATALQVQAEFRNVGFTATAASGVVNGMTIENVSGGIADFRDSVLRLKGQVHGKLDQGLRYVQQSPVGPMIGSLFQQVTGKGGMQAQANLLLPIKEIAKRQVDIDVRLQDATIGLSGSSQQATNIEGKFHIANESITGVALQGQFLQGALSAASVIEHGNNNVVVTGHALAAPLSEFVRLPAFVKIDGEMNYRLSAPGYVQRNSNGRRTLFAVDSDLTGLQLNMPVPVAKAATVSRPIHVEAELLDTDVMQVRGSHDALRAVVRLQNDKSGWKFDRAGLRVDGIAAALPGDSGLRIEGNLPELVLDDWLKIGSASARQSVAESVSSPATVAKAASIHVQDILRSANVNIGKLYLYGFEWPDLRAVLQATDDGWRVDASSEQTTGQVIVPYAFDSGLMTVDMDKLSLLPAASNAERDAASHDRAAQFDPRELPAMLINVRDFHFGEHGFGELQARALRAVQGLQVDSIQIESESFKGNGSGTWMHSDAGSIANLLFSIESSDVRKSMQLLHYADFIAAKHGRLQANLSWPGGMDGELLGRSSGTMEIQLDDGRLLTVQPGAGRMLGLMSIAELPRRLRLDFHDVTDKGLAFDSIHGSFEVKEGNATTPNLLLRGPVAEIGIAGRIGLGKRDYDQTAVVTGDVGSALPVAGVALANPLVGGALLLFTQIFKEPLKGIARAYYHIGGGWDNPKVERIDPDAGRASMLNTVQESVSSSASSSSLSSSSSTAAARSSSPATSASRVRKSAAHK